MDFQLNLSLAELRKRTNKEHLKNITFLTSKDTAYTDLSKNDKKVLACLDEAGKLFDIVSLKQDNQYNLEFLEYLKKEITKCLVDKEFYTILDYTYVQENGCHILGDVKLETEKAMYNNVLHFILCNMEDTTKIQIYDDGAVRMYQHDGWMRLSIWWDTPSCYTHPLNLYLLDKLIEFVREYRKF